LIGFPFGIFTGIMVEDWFYHEEEHLQVTADDY